MVQTAAQEARTARYKELCSKLAWAIGTTYGVRYSGPRTKGYEAAIRAAHYLTPGLEASGSADIDTYNGRHRVA